MAYNTQQPLVQQDNGGEWKESLCNCSPCGSCMLGCCLPCVLAGKTSDRLRDPSMQSASTCNSDCMIGCLFYCIGFPWIHTMLIRRKVRERFDIPGNCCGDCCTTFWCSCCATIQQDNEVKARLLASGPIQQPYQSQQHGMVMPAPQQAHTPPHKESFTPQSY